MTRSEKADALYREHENLYKEGNNSLALEKLEQAAALGAVYAQHALAYDYYNGNPPRKREALVLYRLAAGKGDFASAWNIARHYELELNGRWYRFWLQKAYSLGMVEAATELEHPFPYIIKEGKSAVKKGKLSLAKKLFEFAAKNGSHEAATELTALA